MYSFLWILLFPPHPLPRSSGLVSCHCTSDTAYTLDALCARRFRIYPGSVWALCFRRCFFLDVGCLSPRLRPAPPCIRSTAVSTSGLRLQLLRDARRPFSNASFVGAVVTIQGIWQCLWQRNLPDITLWGSHGNTHPGLRGSHSRCSVTVLQTRRPWAQRPREALLP